VDSRNKQRLIWLAVLLVSTLVHVAILFVESVPPVPDQNIQPTPLQWIELPAAPLSEPQPVPTNIEKETPIRRKAVGTAPAKRPLIRLSDRESLTPQLPADAPQMQHSTPMIPRLDAILLKPENVRGVTLLNDGGAPDTQAILLAEGQRVGAISQGWANEISAEVRAETGNVDARLMTLRRELDTAVETSDDIATMPLEIIGQNISSYSAGAERYAKTGAPFEEAVSRNPSLRIPTILTTQAAQQSQSAIERKAILEAGAALRDFGEGRSGIQLSAVVDLTHDTAGNIVRISLVKASADARFNAWVLERAQTVIEARDAGVTASAISRWDFVGRVSYMRHVSDIKAQDALYVAIGGITGMFTGRFDEVRGTAEYVDLRHPHFECNVRFVRELKTSASVDSERQP
jgi:hypothetical protein